MRSLSVALCENSTIIDQRMFRVEFDQTENGLVIAYAGNVNAEETHRCAREVEAALVSVQPGFRLLVDLTGLESMEVACSPVIASIMEICNTAGVAEVVRIIPDPTRDIGLQIISFFHYDKDVCIRTCASLAEAMEMLQTEST
jgi:anti-anti-sigma regulatory factor